MYKAISAICLSSALLVPAVALAQGNSAAAQRFAPGQTASPTTPGQMTSKAAGAPGSNRAAAQANAPGQKISAAAHKRNARRKAAR
jgi:hypothetical protein